MSHFNQKLFILGVWLCINLALIIPCIIFTQYWYIFIVPLSLSTSFNCLSVFLILAVRIKNLFIKPKKAEKSEYSKKSIAFLVPCYNESEKELTNTIDSLKAQTEIENNKKMLFVVCDGHIKGPDSDTTTNNILKTMFKDQIKESKYFENAYSTWSDEKNGLELLYGYTNDIPFILFIKDNNVGKRDSLVLVRSLVYNFSKGLSNSSLSSEFETFFSRCVLESGIENFDYIVGTDADTVFDKECTSKLLEEIDWDPNTHGVVGFVHVSPQMPKWSLWTIYQFSEYIIAECLRRVQQSIVTNKVSCLSGCVQILRVSEETCGEKILKEFNKCPEKDDNVWRHILSFASEDRNHVCIMLHMYPHVKTRQSLWAKAYTTIPTSISVFKSQRRRWSLGATSNDILLTYKSGINLYERIGAMFNVLTYAMSLFIFVATILFYYTIFTNPSIIMLYLSTVIFIPILYEICIIFWFPFDNKTDIFRFLLGLLIYLIFGALINIMISVYSLANVDCFKWGKTRIATNNQETQAIEMSEVIIQE